MNKYLQGFHLPDSIRQIKKHLFVLSYEFSTNLLQRLVSESKLQFIAVLCSHQDTRVFARLPVNGPANRGYLDVLLDLGNVARREEQPATVPGIGFQPSEPPIYRTSLFFLGSIVPCEMMFYLDANTPSWSGTSETSETIRDLWPKSGSN